MRLTPASALAVCSSVKMRSRIRNPSSSNCWICSGVMLIAFPQTLCSLPSGIWTGGAHRLGELLQGVAGGDIVRAEFLRLMQIVAGAAVVPALKGQQPPLTAVLKIVGIGGAPLV